jgi:hypothetical protein
MGAQEQVRYLAWLCGGLGMLNEMRPLSIELLARADDIARMISDLVKLEVEEIYDAFVRGRGTGEGLLRQLEPLLVGARTPAQHRQELLPEDGQTALLGIVTTNVDGT